MIQMLLLFNHQAGKKDVDEDRKRMEMGGMRGNVVEKVIRREKMARTRVRRRTTKMMKRSQMKKTMMLMMMMRTMQKRMKKRKKKKKLMMIMT